MTRLILATAALPFILMAIDVLICPIQGIFAP